LKTGKHIHRGALLQQYVEESGLSVTQLTKRVGYSRSSYYNHINDANLPIDILLKYGKVIKHDFFVDFPELMSNVLYEPHTDFASLSNAETIEEAIKQRDTWKEKYFELLEKYHLLKEKLEKA